MFKIETVNRRMLNLTQTLLANVIHIAEQAGEHLRYFYHRSVKVQMKSDSTPVTEADLFVSQFLMEKLTALTPHIPILSEECCHIPLSVRCQWPQYWLIDPLDGTQQFINHTDQFGVLIALMQGNQPVLGVIHIPMSKQTFSALQGTGSFKQGNFLKPRQIDFNQHIRIAVGSTLTQQKLLPFLNPCFRYQFIIYGSSGLKGTLVAEGKADCYVRLGKTGEWDTAASEILLAQLGGCIVNKQFEPLTYNQHENFDNPDFMMLCSNQAQWRQVFFFID